MKKSVLTAVLKDIGPILWRNIFSLVVVIIGGLSILLMALGDTRDGIFLGVVILINIVVGIVQELRARVALEKLQAMTAQQYDVTRFTKSHKVYAQQILLGDIVHVTLGDQVPVDGVLHSSDGVECNEALLSGESENISKAKGDKILAGSIIVAGSGNIKAQKTAENSYLAVMTQSLKKFKKSLSPIQKSLLRFIELMAIILAIMAIVILLRAYFNGESFVSGIVQIAAVAATIIAEGLLLASTAFFVYGAVRMAKSRVLLQQINAIETLGRVAVVCIDKTGTLTENNPVFESLMCFGSNTDTELQKLLSTYLVNEAAQTSTSQALSKLADKQNTYTVKNILAFSSARKYGAIELTQKQKILVVGASDYFSKQLPNDEQGWVNEQVSELSKNAKRVLFVGVASKGKLADPGSLKDLHCIGLVVMSNALKIGTKDTVSFLQKRGIQVIVISGDNPHTVRAVAAEAGILSGKKILSGSQVETMTDSELLQAVASKPLFARILPSQKERIVAVCQSTGALTAMIGDGANDALAIKKANVGIAMFSGAPASRQIADAVLLNDSFASLPKGIELSDTIITTLEMVACLFFSRVWAGVILLFSTLVFNMDYPFSPRNITLLNLFIVGFPLLLWTFWPRHRVRSIHEESFLVRTLPFSIMNAVLIAVVTFASYIGASSIIQLSGNQGRMFAYIVFLIMSIFTINLIPFAMGVIKDSRQQFIIWTGYSVMLLAVIALLVFPQTTSFFSLQQLSIKVSLVAVILGATGAILQHLATKFHLGNKIWKKITVYLAHKEKIPSSR